jgi:hypothetical protein
VVCGWREEGLVFVDTTGGDAEHTSPLLPVAALFVAPNNFDIEKDDDDDDEMDELDEEEDDDDDDEEDADDDDESEGVGKLIRPLLVVSFEWVRNFDMA